MTAPKKKSWIVTMTRTVRTEVTVVGCTEEQARANPWDFAEDERDIDQMDWDVEKVEPNE